MFVKRCERNNLVALFNQFLNLSNTSFPPRKRETPIGQNYFAGISRRTWFRRKCINISNKLTTFFLTNCCILVSHELAVGKLFFAIDEVRHFELKHWTIYLEHVMFWNFFL